MLTDAIINEMGGDGSTEDDEDVGNLIVISGRLLFDMDVFLDSFEGDDIKQSDQ